MAVFDNQAPNPLSLKAGAGRPAEDLIRALQRSRHRGFLRMESIPFRALFVVLCPSIIWPSTSALQSLLTVLIPFFACRWPCDSWRCR